MSSNVLQRYCQRVRTMRCLLLFCLVGLLTLQHEVGWGFQANPGGRAKFKIVQYPIKSKRVKPTTFVEVTLLDQTLIKSIPQRLYIHLGITHFYNRQTRVVWTKTLEFAPGSATATVAFDREFYADESLNGNEITWIRVTTGPSPQSKSVALGAFFNDPMGTSHTLDNYLFLSSTPAVSSYFPKLISDISDTEFRESLAAFDISKISGIEFYQSNSRFNPAEMPTLEHLPNNLERDENQKIAWKVTPEGTCGITAELIRNGYYFGDTRYISEHWLGLSPFAKIFISEEDLRRLRQESPQKLRAIADRVAAGGQLVITECSPGFEIRKSLRSWLSNSNDIDTQRHPELLTKFWQLKPESYQYDDLALFEAQLNDQIRKITSERVTIANNRTYIDGFEPTSANPTEPIFRAIGQLKISLVPIDSPTSGEVDFATTAWGRGGLVMTTLAAKEFEDIHWHALLELSQYNPNVPFDNLVGVDTLQANPEYLGVPGVGQPPLLLFLALVTGFALAVGPGCLLLLARFRRKNLILLLAPLLSLLATLILIGYGLLIDRLDYQVARLSSTYLDQRNQIAITHSQNAIFSGRKPNPVPIAPSQLLSVTQFCSSSHQYRWRFDESFVVNAINSPTSVTGTIMRARTLHQITTVGVVAHESKFRIELPEESDDGNPTLTAVNQLGFPIELAIVRHKKSIYLLRDCPSGTTIPLLEVSEAEVSDALKSYSSEILERCLDRRDLRGKTIPGSLLTNVFKNEDLRRMSTNQGQTYSYCRVLAEPLTWLEDGHFFIIARDNPWLQDLNPDPLIKYQIHLIHGSWR